MDENNIVHTYIKELNDIIKTANKEKITKSFEELIALEQEFAKVLKNTATGRAVYLSFINTIIKMKGGIKVAKPYFRERQSAYIDTINVAIAKGLPKLLYDAPINFRFCDFAIKNIKKPNDKLLVLFEKIKNKRNEIVTSHLHIALNKAKIFNKSSFMSSVDFSDLIQLGNEGLVMAVDKYVVEESSPDFYVMAIGRIIANLITGNGIVSAVSVGQHSQKKLYQIQRLLQKSPDLDRKSVSDILKIAEGDVNDLLSAVGYASLDEEISEGGTRLIDITEDISNAYDSPDDIAEHKNLLDVLRANFSLLDIIERKVLRLKGVNVNENSQ